jgi:LPXTG-motif cell wall-anchored protein
MVRVADAEDGGSPLAVLAAVALVGLLVAGAVVLVRRRRRPPVDVVATG